jgi:hypothetical protein
MITLWLRDQLAGHLLEHETQQYLQRLRQAPVLRSQNAATLLLRQLRRQPPPHVRLGDTTWGEPVIVPLTELVKACGLITGGMGAGKTMAALLPIRAIIQRLPSLSAVSCGAIDPKGELFDRMLYLLAARIQELHGREQQELLERLVIIDFSNRNAISSYNILHCPPDADADFFISSRLETLRELLAASERPSVPATSVLRNAIALLVESGRPAPDLGRLLADGDFRQQLAARSRNPEVRHYFQRLFTEVPKQTIGALRSRFDALFASDSVRLALSGSTRTGFSPAAERGQDRSHQLLGTDDNARSASAVAVVGALRYPASHLRPAQQSARHVCLDLRRGTKLLSHETAAGRHDRRAHHGTLFRVILLVPVPEPHDIDRGCQDR